MRIPNIIRELEIVERLKRGELATNIADYFNLSDASITKIKKKYASELSTGLENKSKVK